MTTEAITKEEADSINGFNRKFSREVLDFIEELQVKYPCVKLNLTLDGFSIDGGFAIMGRTSILYPNVKINGGAPGVVPAGQPRARFAEILEELKRYVP